MKVDTQQQKATEYNKVFDEKDYEKRQNKAQYVTDNFYTLITKFYERGWENLSILLQDIMAKISKPVSTGTSTCLPQNWACRKRMMY